MEYTGQMRGRWVTQRTHCCKYQIEEAGDSDVGMASWQKLATGDE